MRRSHGFQLLLLLAALLASAIPLAPDARAQSRDALPPPHLGYGIHVAPHTNVNPALVDRLRVDWVKIYEEGQAASFPGKRILLRMDLPWPSNWDAFRASVRQRAASAAAAGVDAI